MSIQTLEKTQSFRNNPIPGNEENVFQIDKLIRVSTSSRCRDKVQTWKHTYILGIPCQSHGSCKERGSFLAVKMSQKINAMKGGLGTQAGDQWTGLVSIHYPGKSWCTACLVSIAPSSLWAVLSSPLFAVMEKECKHLGPSCFTAGPFLKKFKHC